MKRTVTLKERAGQLCSEIPAVFLCLKDRDTPAIARIVAAIAVVYALSPIDLIPDFIPVLGYLDDIILLPALVALTMRLIPPGVWNRHVAQAREMWKDGKPKKWYCALPIIVLWAAIAIWIGKALWR